MRKIVFISVTILLFVLSATAQDKIIMRSRDTLYVQITKSTSQFVEFIYPNETLVNIENKIDIEKIIFSSGRIKIYNERKKIDIPIIKSKNDWKKVVITFDKYDIIGLTACEEIIGESEMDGWFSVRGGEEAIKKMKKKAAKMGAPIILITEGWDQEKNKPISGFEKGVKLTGIAYR